jgi:hypothetical protein
MSQMTRLDCERLLEKLETAREALEFVEDSLRIGRLSNENIIIYIEKTLKDTDPETA